MIPKHFDRLSPSPMPEGYHVFITFGDVSFSVTAGCPKGSGPPSNEFIEEVYDLAFGKWKRLNGLPDDIEVSNDPTL